jgi:hypothetical protein
MQKTLFFALFFVLLPWAGRAQTFSIDWHKVSPGGTSGGTNGVTAYSLSGLAGQPDAGGAMAGGGYSLTGGFWSLISVVQTPGLPMLSISRAGASVVIAWPNTPACALQQSSNLATRGWAACAASVNCNNGTNSATLAPGPGSLFFRLAR